jgi:hypothetical protein
VLVQRVAVLAVGVDRADHLADNQQRQRRADTHLGEPGTEPRPADIIMVTGIVRWIFDAVVAR